MLIDYAENTATATAEAVRTANHHSSGKAKAFFNAVVQFAPAGPVEIKG